MGLLPPIILGALLIVAFALSAQQRLTIASHAGPMPARQIAYLMRVHHEAAIRLKQANPALDTVTDALNDNDDLFLSCIQNKTVATVMMTLAGTGAPTLMIGATEAGAVTEELARQSVLAPELGRAGQTPWSVGYGAVPAALVTPVAGIGIIDASLTIRTATGPVPVPAGCQAVPGAPAMLTQALP